MLETIALYTLGILASLFAGIAVFSPHLVRSIIAFAMLLLAIVGFFAVLAAPFLALGQLVIFVGGLIALLLFGVVFGRNEDVESKAHMPTMTMTRFFAAGFIFIILFASFAGSLSTGASAVDFGAFSIMLFTEYWEGLLLGVFGLFIAVITAIFLMEKE